MINILGWATALILMAVGATLFISLVITPAVRAASLTRYIFKLYQEHYIDEAVSYPMVWISAYTDFFRLGSGLTFVSPKGYWYGVGRWKVHPKK